MNTSDSCASLPSFHNGDGLGSRSAECLGKSDKESMRITMIVQIVKLGLHEISAVAYTQGRVVRTLRQRNIQT